MPPKKLMVGIVVVTLALCHWMRSWTPPGVLLATAAMTAGR
jgi:hypothetical protein